MTTRKKYSELYSFGITIVATFIGVFLAIHLTNYAETKKEEENVVNLLNATVMDLDNIINDANLNIYTMKFQSDSVFSSLKDCQPCNPMRLPRLFQSIVTNEAVLRHLSPIGIQKFNECAYVNSSYQEIINNLPQDYLFLKNVQFYIERLEFEKEIISIEIDRIKGEISENKLDRQYHLLQSKSLDEVIKIVEQSKNLTIKRQ